MQKIRIGVWDTEQKYVISLAAYLQRYGKGRWEMSAFSEEEMLDSYLKQHSLDFLLGTDKESLLKRRENFHVIPLWLRNQKEDSQDNQSKIYSTYRFQSAEDIGKYIEGIVRQERKGIFTEKPIIAVYSPVGRCGKTTMALNIVRSGVYGKWIYIGMEDYSSFEEMENQQSITDDFLYYWKERNEEKMFCLLEQVQGVLATGNSFIDTKGILEEDVQWFKEALQKSDYSGALFDIGSGVLQNLQMFKKFNNILVPYIKEKEALIKKHNFEKLLQLQNLEDYKDRIHFLDMDKMPDQSMVIQKLFGGEV